MEKVAQYRAYVKQILQHYGAYLPQSESIETQYVFDTEHDHYQVWQVGWDEEEYDRIYGCILHVDIKNGKIWVQHNGIEQGIADDFVDMGVPKNDIVLGFHAPYKRKYTGFAEG